MCPNMSMFFDVNAVPIVPSAETSGLLNFIQFSMYGVRVSIRYFLSGYSRLVCHGRSSCVYLFVHLGLSICLSPCVFVCVYGCLSECMSFRMHVVLYVYLSVCLSVCLSGCLYPCMYVSIMYVLCTCVSMYV